MPRGLSRSALPLVAIGAGVYWLYRANRRSGNGFADYQGYAEYSEFDFGPGPMDEAETSASGLRGRARNVGDRISGLAGGTRERVGKITARTRSGLERNVQNRPLALAMMAVAAGLVVGFSLPASQRERRLMGDARDRLMGKAQQAARDASTRVREAVGLTS
jgi:hypothetical protein